MKIGLAQINVVSGDVEANTEKMLGFISRAKNSSCDLIIFPEMSDTGYDMDVILKKANEWGEGPVPILRKSAKENGINIIAGVSKKTPKGVFNGVVSIDRGGGIVNEYFKTHLITAEPMLEHESLVSGEEIGVFEIEGIRIGIMTCYEIRFPEIARTMALQGADLIVIPAAWPLVRLPHWQNLAMARAIENQLYVAATDRIGNDTGLQFAGTSMLIGPYGDVMASGTQIHEDLLIGRIDLATKQMVRDQIKVHQDRRPELYKL